MSFVSHLLTSVLNGFRSSIRVLKRSSGSVCPFTDYPSLLSLTGSLRDTAVIFHPDCLCPSHNNCRDPTRYLTGVSFGCSPKVGVVTPWVSETVLCFTLPWTMSNVVDNISYVLYWHPTMCLESNVLFQRRTVKGSYYNKSSYRVYNFELWGTHFFF